MDMKLEKRVGNRSVYSTVIDGHVKRATTVNGEAGARRIFAIMQATHGVATAPATRMDLGATTRS